METEAQRVSVIHLRPPSWKVAELGFEPGSPSGPGAVAHEGSGEALDWRERGDGRIVMCLVWSEASSLCVQEKLGESVLLSWAVTSFMRLS